MNIKHSPRRRPGPADRSTLPFRLAMLPPGDRMLMHLRTGKGLTCDEVGAVVGLSAGQVSRRARTLWNRLQSEQATWLASAAVQTDADLGTDDLRVGFYRHIAGLSVRRIGLVAGMSQPAVRKRLRRLARLMTAE